MASSVHQPGRRARTAPPPAKTPKSITPAAKGTPVAGSPSERAVDVVLVGAGTMDLAGYISALGYLEQRGEIRVHALVGLANECARHVTDVFPRALKAPALDKVVLAPGALVLLASSAHLHPAQAGAALRRGWHVLSIAPLARTIPDATAMVAAAQRNERLLAAALPWRFSPAVQYLRVLCHDQLIGPLVGFEIHDGAPASPAAADVGDGVLTDVGLYVFDLLSWCVGPPTIKSYADDAMGGIEANAFVEIVVAGGIDGTVHLSADWPTTQSYEFVFERGVVRWRADDCSGLALQLSSTPATLEARTVPLGTGVPAGEPTSGSSRAGHIVAQLKNVLCVITNRESLSVTTDETLHAMTLVQHCHSHRTLLEPPWLSRNETAHARALSTPA